MIVEDMTTIKRHFLSPCNIILTLLQCTGLVLVLHIMLPFYLHKCIRFIICKVQFLELPYIIGFYYTVYVRNKAMLCNIHTSCMHTYNCVGYFIATCKLCDLHDIYCNYDLFL